MLAAQGLREGDLGTSRILDKDLLARVKREGQKVLVGSVASAALATSLLAFVS